MHGLDTIKRLNQEAGDKERRDFMNDCLENEVFLNEIKDDIIKDLTNRLISNGNIPGVRIA